MTHDDYNNDSENVRLGVVTVTHFFAPGTDNYLHSQYCAVGTPAELLRIGICRHSKTTKSGITPNGHLVQDGTMRVYADARRAIRSDERFREAMARVLAGEAMPAFALPRRKRSSGRGDPEVAG